MLEQRGVVSVFPEQVEAPQTVFADAAQPPVPLQVSSWQFAESAVHSFFGSVPFVALTQEVPAVLTTRQVAQVSPAVAQRKSF